jgi:hypothetical protein
MASRGLVPGAAKLLVVDGVALLRPEEQVFAAMLTGFANQQLARNLARTTVEGREGTIKAFAAYVDAYPWQWTPGMVDEWLGDLRSLRDLKRSRPSCRGSSPTATTTWPGSGPSAARAGCRRSGTRPCHSRRLRPGAPAQTPRRHGPGLKGQP